MLVIVLKFKVCKNVNPKNAGGGVPKRLFSKGRILLHLGKVIIIIIINQPTVKESWSQRKNTLISRVEL